MELIATCTSFPKRINVLPITLMSLARQSRRPNRIIVNLCEAEFSSKSYRDHITTKFNAISDLIEVHWVKSNTYTFKKTFPTVDRYHDCLIFTFDDDIIYPNNTIECFEQSYYNYEGKYNITLSQALLGGKLELLNRGMLYIPNILNDYRYYLTDDMINTKDDDYFTYTMLRSKASYVAPVDGIDFSEMTFLDNESTWMDIDHVDDVIKNREWFDSQLSRFCDISEKLSSNYIIPGCNRFSKEFIQLDKYTAEW